MRGPPATTLLNRNNITIIILPNSLISVSGIDFCFVVDSWCLVDPLSFRF